MIGLTRDAPGRRFLAFAFALTLLSGCGDAATATPTALATAATPATPTISGAANTATPTPAAGPAVAATAAVPTAPPTVAPATANPTRPRDPAPTFATLATATAPPPAATPIAPGTRLTGEALVEALRRGGFVIYFRHAATDFSITDTDRQNLENCATQRNLSEVGREDARAIGAAFRRLAVPVGPVLASRYCRTRETAELAFGRAETTRDLVSTASARDETERATLVATLRALLAAAPPPATNTILVGHDFNIRAATELGIAEGEAAIFLPHRDGTFSLVARVTAAGWLDLP